MWKNRRAGIPRKTYKTEKDKERPPDIEIQHQ